MQLPLGETIYLRIFTHDDTGASTDADSTPTVDVTEDGGAAFTTGVTVTNVTTGEYKAVVQLFSGHGYEVGKWYDIAATATVGTVVSKQRLIGVRIGPAENNAGYQVVDLTYWKGASPANLTANSRVEVDTKDWNGLTTVELPLVPTTAGRKLDVSPGGEAGLDWANVGSPATVQGLTNTTVKTATDVEADTQDIQGRLPAALSGGNMKSDMLAISTDTGAADALESQFDTTGLSGATYPATQAQASAILERVASVAVAGSPSSTIASRTLTTGSETNTIANTKARDGTYWDIDDAAGAISLTIDFDDSATVGSIGTDLDFEGYLTGVGNVIAVSAFNWGGSAYEQIGTINGTASALIESDKWELSNAHTQAGIRRIKFAGTGLTAAKLRFDRVLGGYAIVPPTVAAIQSGLATSAGQTTIIADIAALPTASEIDTQLSGTHSAGSWAGDTAANVADAVWDESRAGHVIAGSFGEGVVVSSLVTAAQDMIVDSIMAYSHDTGVTVRGAFRRMDAFVAGKATGLRSAIARFFMRDGTTAAIQASQNVTAGTREAASVAGSES